MNLSTADLRNYRTEFRETWWSYRYMFLVAGLYINIFFNLSLRTTNQKSTCPTQSFSCPKKLIQITKTRELLSKAPTTFRELTGRSGRQQREVERLLGEKSIAINQNIVSRPL